MVALRVRVLVVVGLCCRVNGLEFLTFAGDRAENRFRGCDNVTTMRACEHVSDSVVKILSELADSTSGFNGSGQYSFGKSTGSPSDPD